MSVLTADISTVRTTPEPTATVLVFPQPMFMMDLELGLFIPNPIVLTRKKGLLPTRSMLRVKMLNCGQPA